MARTWRGVEQHPPAQEPPRWPLAFFLTSSSPCGAVRCRLRLPLLRWLAIAAEFKALKDAIYHSIPFFVQTFYGGIATFDVYESLNVKEGQTSDAGIWVAFYEQGHIYNLNIVTAGWSIDPVYYGDNRTHFLVGWSSKDDGDWWLHFAHAGEKFAPVGYWPRSLFNSLAYYANYVSWGGFTGSLVGAPSPPMGNGHWPGQDSATFHDVQYVNSDGKGYPPVPAPGLQSRVTHKD
ncbi:hypothetical protein ZWY2020_015767 [Hordeum vulgare]|nr:hypothetical protein ZWY2020_015767 [Hordeum vulgare]